MAKRSAPRKHDNDNDEPDEPKKSGAGPRGIWSGSISVGGAGPKKTRRPKKRTEAA